MIEPDDPSLLRSFEVAMSVDALASAWARTEHAPAGATVVVAHEISGRLRGGPPWKTGGADALMMAVVLRPSITIAQEPLLWLVATLATARATEAVTGTAVGVVWPDTVVAERDVDTTEPAVSVNVSVQLGPGRLEHAIVAVRARCSPVGLSPQDRDRFVAEVRSHLRIACSQLEREPAGLIDTFVDSWAGVDTLMIARLLPRGEARGRVVTIDAEGRLVLESPTGMLERVLPGHLRSLHPA